MATLLDKIHDAMQKAGVDANSLKDFTVKNADLSKVEVPDELIKGFDSLMSIEAAASNPEVKKRLRAESLNPADKVILDRAKKLGDEKYKAIEAESNTYKRLEMLADAQEEQIKEAAKKGNNSDEVTRLNNELATTKQQLKEKENEYNTNLTKVQKEYHQKDVDRVFSGWVRNQKLAPHLIEDAEFGIGYVKNKFEKALSSLGVEGIGYDIDQTGNIVLGKRNGDNLEKAFDPTTNKPLTFEDFAGKVLAENKLLAVSNPSAGGIGSTTNPPVIIPGQPPAATPKAFSIPVPK